MVEKFYEKKLDADIVWYKKKYSNANYKTIYHNPYYLLAEEQAEDYAIHLFVMESGSDFVILPSIKRRINDLKIFDYLQKEYWDITTPHEYSGVLASTKDIHLLGKFYERFGVYCKNNNIIFSFIRFNPYEEEHLIANVKYKIEKSGKQVWINCANNNFVDDISKSARRNYKYAQKRDLIIEFQKGDFVRNNFEILYKDSMDRLNSKIFFYFSKKYFEKLSHFSETEWVLVWDKEHVNVLAGAILLKDKFNHRIYYHLSCRNSQVDCKGVMEFLIIEFTAKVRKEGFDCIHLGGAPRESLLDFKCRFSHERIDYFVGYAIFEDGLYNELCAKYLKENPQYKDCKFLPLYRC